jgi:hypothetical protein
VTTATAFGLTLPIVAGCATRDAAAVKPASGSGFGGATTGWRRATSWTASPDSLGYFDQAPATWDAAAVKPASGSGGRGRRHLTGGALVTAILVSLGDFDPAPLRGDRYREREGHAVACRTKRQWRGWRGQPFRNTHRK